MTHTRRDQLVLGLRWTALVLILIPAAVRASVVMSPMVGWELDPLVIAAPLVGLGPSGFAFMNAGAILALGLAMLGDALSGRSMPRWSLTLWALGSAAAAWHGLVLEGGELDHLRIGLAWSGALAGAVALLSLCRDERMRSLTLAFTLGFLAMLAAKGGLQVLVEHPATVRTYDADPERFLASQGWTPGSRSALIYERRLRQPEAIGWFGLANVFATFAAAGVVAFAGFLRAALLSRGSEGWQPRAAIAGLGLLVALASLAMAGAKGGYGAALVGVALVFTGAWSARRLGPLAGLLGLGMIWLTILAIVARGVIGEAIGELSLLFRAFYLDAAARIYLEHPIRGVGPGDFKNAYLLTKPPTSPEEVSGPHSVLLDFAATLGLGGLAWAGLVLRLAWMNGSRALDPAPDPDRETLPTDVRLLLLGAACATIAGAIAETAASTIENALVRLLGVGLWIALGWGVLRVLREGDGRSRGAALWAAAAAGIALLVHAQIEMTLTTLTSGALALAIVAAACAHSEPSQERQAGRAKDTKTTPRRRNNTWQAAAIASCVLVIGLGSFVAAWWPIASWSRAMARAYATVGDLAELRQRADVAAPADLPPLAAELTRELGVSVPASESQVRGAWSVLATQRLRIATDHLARAHALQPNHLPTAEVYQRTLLQRAALAPLDAPFDERIGPAMEAESIANAMTMRRGDMAEAWAQLASVRLARAELAGEAEDAAAQARLLREGAAATRRAHELDPYGLAHPVRLVEIYTRLGDDRAARAWANRALAINERLYLDPLRQLRDARRSWLEEIARGG